MTTHTALNTTNFNARIRATMNAEKIARAKKRLSTVHELNEQLAAYGSAGLEFPAPPIWDELTASALDAYSGRLDRLIDRFRAELARLANEAEARVIATQTPEQRELRNLRARVADLEAAA